MKKHLIICSIAILTLSVLEARPGGGGGRGGGGRARMEGGATRSIQRSSPSMSRARHDIPGAGPQVSRSNRGASDRPSFANGQYNRGAPTRNQMQQFLHNQPGANNRNNYRNLGNNVRHNFNNHYPNHNWFNNGFWGRYNLHPAYYNHNGNWWAAATVAGVGSWLNWGGGVEPYYYGYDDSSDTTQDDNSDNSYADNQPPPPPPADYSQQFQTIDTAQNSNSNDDWMPLGVFAVSKNDESEAAPNMYIQLALNKSGVISGALYVTSTDQAYPLEGWVDPQTQIASWKMAKNADSAIVETGIYNLTEQEVPIRVYFNNNTSQEMLLVRVDENQQ